MPSGHSRRGSDDVRLNRMQDADSLFAHGKALADQGQLVESVEALRAAIKERPRFPEAHLKLGAVLLGLERLDEAAETFTVAAAQAAEPAEARYQLAKIYHHLRRLTDAETEARAVISLRPDWAKAYNVLGVILNESGRPRDGVTAFADAMRVDPGSVNVATNWVSTHQYLDDISEPQLRDIHRYWAELHAPAPAPRMFSNPRTANRPLVVGFVSPDLGEHPVGFLSVRLLENLDRTQIRPMVFSTKPQVYEDKLSARIARTSSWTTVHGVPTEDLVGFIQACRVDVLIDMTGHTANNSLALFARRAAPVQVTWLGYTGTTGIPAMNYLLSNAVLTPPGSEAFCSERVVRLPHWHACFEPPPEAPAVGPLPAARAEHVTFGCFNNPLKFSDSVIATYARILHRVRGARLKLKYRTLTDPDFQMRLRAAFAAQGIAPERLAISGEAPWREFLDAYNEVDIVLDTFPYSGCMTTCEASWMGCPVVAFPGATFAGRQAAAFLTAAGLSRFVVKDRAGFEDLAVSLAQNPAELRDLRAEMRERISASPVCDAVGFAQDFTGALRAMWADWCAAAAGPA